jgi:hypothetical protein
MLGVGRLSPHWLRRAGLLLTTLAGAGLTAVVLWVLIVWYPDTYRKAYVVHRIVFVIITMIDAPLVEGLFAGLVCWMVGRRRARKQAAESRGVEP